MKNRLTLAAAKSALLAGNGVAVNCQFRTAEPSHHRSRARNVICWLLAPVMVDARQCWIALPAAARRLGLEALIALCGREQRLLEMDRCRIAAVTAKITATPKPGNAHVVNTNTPGLPQPAGDAASRRLCRPVS